MQVVSNEGVEFSIIASSAWAPGVETDDAWLAWARDECAITEGREPSVKDMAPMLRRRAGLLSRMALEVAYRCLDGKIGVTTVFCSRHGEAARSVDLLSDLAKGVPLSPTSFGLSVHNAAAGLFSIARCDRASSTALAAGKSSVEHGVIEACGLLAEGEPEVLLVVYDCPLPKVYAAFQDCREQPYAWAWLMRPPAEDLYTLDWRACEDVISLPDRAVPGGLEILRFQLRKEAVLERTCDRRRWLWTFHAK